MNGEGEVSLEALLRSTDLASVPGIQYRACDGSVARNAAAPLIADLDAQPWPDRERDRHPAILARLA